MSMWSSLEDSFSYSSTLPALCRGQRTAERFTDTAIGLLQPNQHGCGYQATSQVVHEATYTSPISPCGRVAVRGVNSKGTGGQALSSNGPARTREVGINDADMVLRAARVTEAG